MKKRNAWPARRDSRITSQFVPDTGDIVIGVAKGITGSGEILYRITPEVLAGAIEDRKELAVIVNNLGLLVLAQLSGFNLAESLEDLPRALAKWGHMEKEFNEVAAEKQVAEALAIAQKTIHQMHGHQGGCEAPDRAKGEPCVCKCECYDTAVQTICAQWCELCGAADGRINEQERLAVQAGWVEPDEGQRADSGPAEGAGPGRQTSNGQDPYSE